MVGELIFCFLLVFENLSELPFPQLQNDKSKVRKENEIISCIEYKGSVISCVLRGFDCSAVIPSEDTGVLVTAK